MKVAVITTDLRDDHRRYHEPEPSFGTAPTAFLHGLSAQREFEVHVISCVQQPVASPAKIFGNLFYHSVLVKKPGWLRGAYLGCILGVRRTLRAIRPDIVHGHGTERYCALSAVFSGRPNIVTIHGNMRRVAEVNRARPFTFDWLAARLEGFTIPRAGGIICLSTHTQRMVADLARRTWVVPNAVDAEFFDIDHPEPTGRPVLLCVGHIGTLKNQVTLIRALDPLASEFSFELRFLGAISAGQPTEREFPALLQDRPWCVHAGFADRTALQRHLAEAYALIHPSLEENCPMVVLEAMAAGLPVAASRVGGIPDLVEPELTGLLFDPTDPGAMLSAARRLLADPALAARFGREGREIARARFEPGAVGLRHLEIYSELLEGGTM